MTHGEIYVNGISINGNVSTLAAAFHLDTSALGEPSADFSFTLVPNGDNTDNLLLNYQALPEPTNVTLVVAGAIPLLGRRPRRIALGSFEGQAD